MLRINFPMNDPSRRGAPAACSRGLRFWPMSTCAAPGSRAKVDAKVTVRGISQLARSVKQQHYTTLRGYANTLFYSHTTPRLQSVYTCPFSNRGNLRHMVANYPFPNSQRKDKLQEDCLPFPHIPPPHITTNQYYLWKPSILLMGPSTLQIKTKLLINPHALSLLGHIHTFFSSSKQNYSSLLSTALFLFFGFLSILSLLFVLLMASITEEDEALIQRFIGLHTNDSSSPALKMPSGATSSTDWSRCLLSRIISNRVAIESQFQQAMMKAWDADPNTSFKSVAKNTFLLEFTDLLDLQTALNGGPWTFKGDLVAFKLVKSHEEFKPSEIKEASLWVQLFHVPLNAFSDEGLILLGKEVGVPVSRPVEGYVGGKRFYKIKVTIKLEEPLKDKVRVTHPVLGDLTMYCVFEKVSRICIFCGLLGHDLGTCADHSRLATLMQKPDQAARFPGQQLLKPTRGPWITDVTLIPRAQLPAFKSNLKRHFHQTSPTGPSPLSNQGLPSAELSENLNCLVTVLEGETVPASSSSSQLQPKKPRSAGRVPLPTDL